MKGEAMKDAFASMRETPFNSCYQILKGAGVEPLEELGGECLFLGRELGKRLVEAGSDPGQVSFVKSVNNRMHYGVVCEDDSGEEFLMDPYLLHWDPIPLCGVLEKGGLRGYNANPVVQDRPTKVLVASVGGGCVSVSADIYGRDGHREIWEAVFNISAQARLASLPEDGEDGAVDIHREKLLLRLLLDDGTIARLSYDLRGQCMDIRNIGHGRVFREGEEGFDRQIELIAERLRVDVDAIVRNFKVTEEAYHARRQELGRRG